MENIYLSLSLPYPRIDIYNVLKPYLFKVSDFLREFDNPEETFYENTSAVSDSYKENLGPLIR